MEIQFQESGFKNGILGTRNRIVQKTKRMTKMNYRIRISVLLLFLLIANVALGVDCVERVTSSADREYIATQDGTDQYKTAMVYNGETARFKINCPIGNTVWWYKLIGSSWIEVKVAESLTGFADCNFEFICGGDWQVRGYIKNALNQYKGTIYWTVTVRDFEADIEARSVSMSLPSGDPRGQHPSALSGSVKNNGPSDINSTTGNYYYYFIYLSTDNIISSSDTEIGILDTNHDISVGSTYSWTATSTGRSKLTIPSNMPAGVYYVGMIVYPVIGTPDDPTYSNNDIYGNTVTIPAIPDTTPPTPNPMSFSTDPYATGQTSTKMRASSASDDTSSVEYYFDCSSGGGHDSGWQSSRDYEDTGLQSDTLYSYRVKARDSSGNETSYSSSKSARTDAPNYLTISPTSRNHTYSAGSGSISVTSNVLWTASDNMSWVSYPGASVSGDGTLNYSVTENTSTSPRSGSITISGGGITRTFSVSQDPQPITLTISPTSRNHTCSAGSGSISVTSNTSWTASESLSWVSITSGSSGSGNGTVNYSVTENTGTSSRSGQITISGGGITRRFDVSQDPCPEEPVLTALVFCTSLTSEADCCTINVSNSGTGTMTWSATESCPWVTLTGASGSNSGTITVCYTENTSADSRQCTITITAPEASGSPKTVTITQLGNDGGDPTGDVDCSGSVTPGDAQAIFDHYLGIPPAPGCIEEGDVTGDGSITPGDAQCVFNMYLGLPCD